MIRCAVRIRHHLATAAAFTWASLMTAPAQASGSSMPWEAPLQSILESVEGPVAKIVLAGDWGPKLADLKQLNDVAPWRLAVVLESTDQSARIGLYPPRDPGGVLTKERETGLIQLDGLKWAKPTDGPLKGRVPAKVNQILNVGDVVYVEQVSKETNTWRLHQVPEVSGAMVVMDPATGRVLAMVGGFSFDQSQFNRATQAQRQPGSSFKPFVYSAALDNGYTPSTVVMDSPIEIDQGPGMPPWRPENYSSGTFSGPRTLRYGLEQSKNVMTVRLAQDVGMPLIAEYARRFGVYDNLPHYLSYALGAGETTVLRMVTAYSMFDNGGKRIIPTFIDRIQDRYGRTVYKHDQRECRGCNVDKWQSQGEPSLVDRREQVIDPMTAYQITSMMEGVVQRGTATVVKSVGKPIAGKTGTTNEAKDAWFVGFSPDVAVAIYMGYDKPRPLGKGNAATGGHLAAPIARDFLKLALDNPDLRLRSPDSTRGLTEEQQDRMRAMFEILTADQVAGVIYAPEKQRGGGERVPPGVRDNLMGVPRARYVASPSGTSVTMARAAVCGALAASSTASTGPAGRPARNSRSASGVP